MQEISLRYVIQEVIGLVDAGISISIDDIVKHIEEKDIINFLSNEYKNECGLNNYVSKDIQLKIDSLHDKLLNMYGHYESNSWRNFFVKNNGLNLFLTMLIDLALEKK